jgi:nucleotide-binding universal stress UspA family protein
MAEIKTILFATDFSEGATRACRIARELTVLTGAKLILLHVISELHDKQRRQLPVDMVDALTAEIERHAVQDMRHFHATHFADLNPETELVIGNGVDEILSQAAKHNADLIVMGAHGYSGIQRYFVGSTAEKVVHRAKIPVLTVRE